MNADEAQCCWQPESEICRSSVWCANRGSGSYRWKEAEMAVRLLLAERPQQNRASVQLFSAREDDPTTRTLFSTAHTPEDNTNTEVKGQFRALIGLLFDWKLVKRILGAERREITIGLNMREHTHTHTPQNTHTLPKTHTLSVQHQEQSNDCSVSLIKALIQNLVSRAGFKIINRCSL